MVNVSLMLENFISLNFGETGVSLYQSIINENLSKSKASEKVLELLITCLEKKCHKPQSSGLKQCLPFNNIIQPVLLLELDDDDNNSSIANLIVRLLGYTLPTSEGIAMMCNICRNHTYAYTEEDSANEGHISTFQHMAIHAVVLTAISTYMNSVFSPPPFIELPGNRESYITLSVDSRVTCTPLAYTLTLWLWIEQADNSVTLCKCRSPSGGVEVILNPLPVSGSKVTAYVSYNVNIRSIVENMEGSVDGYECEGRIHLLPKTWHLLSLSHNSALGAGVVSFAVDGNVDIERDLPYPFHKLDQILDPLVNQDDHSLHHDTHIHRQAQQWYFATGLCGRVSSITLYDEELHPHSLCMLKEAGPHMHSIDMPLQCCITGNQSYATDTTVVDLSVNSRALGTLWTKGDLAATISSKYTPLFCITALHFGDHSNQPSFGDLRSSLSYLTPALPYHNVGIDTINYSIMRSLNLHESHTEDMMGGSSNVPYLSSEKCVVVAGHNGLSVDWVNMMVGAGGCVPLLYMLYNYCSSPQLHSIAPCSLTNDTLSNSDKCRSAHIKCISSTLNLLASLILSSVDVREQFLQCHGFHIVAHCLQAIPDKHILITMDVVEACYAIVYNYGLESASVGDDVPEHGANVKTSSSTHSDVLTAALQGLLLNFNQVWGNCTALIKEYILTNLVALLLSHNQAGAGGARVSNNTSGELLHRSIGISYLLDILKNYLNFGNVSGSCNLEPVQKFPDLGSDSSVASCNNDLLSLCKASDMCIRLLTMTLDAILSLAKAKKMSGKDNKMSSLHNYSPFREVELLLLALEENVDGGFIERILRIIANLRLIAPNTLRNVLYSVRFSETTALMLLTRPDVSFSSRRLVLLLVIWSFSEDLSKHPDKIVSLRHALASDALSAQMSLVAVDNMANSGGDLLPPRSKITSKRRSSLLDDGVGLFDNQDSPGLRRRNHVGEKKFNNAHVTAAANSLRTAGSKIVKQMRRRSEMVTSGRLGSSSNVNIDASEYPKQMRNEADGSDIVDGIDVGGRHAKASSGPSINRVAGSPYHDIPLRDRNRWESISFSMRPIDKAWHIMTSICDIITQQLPPNAMVMQLGLINSGVSSLRNTTASSCLQFYNELMKVKHSQGTSHDSAAWKIEKDASIESYLPSSPSNSRRVPMSSKATGAPLSRQGSHVTASQRSTELEHLTPLDDFLDLFAHDGPLANANSSGSGYHQVAKSSRVSHLHSWLVLPYLPLFLSYTSLHNCQRTLMSLSVTMKTEESESFLLAMLSDCRSWVTIFAQLAMIGAERKKQAFLAAWQAEVEAEKLAMDSIDSSGSINVTSKGISTEEREATDAEIAETCIELSLDCLAIVIEKKMRYASNNFYNQYHAAHTHHRAMPAMQFSEEMFVSGGGDSGANVNSVLTSPWYVWKIVMNVLRSFCGHAPAELLRIPVDVNVGFEPSCKVPRYKYTESKEKLDRRLLKKILSLVFQRLSRSSEPWTMDMFRCVVELLSLVEEMDLCYCSVLESDVAKLEIGDPSSVVNVDERNLLYFLMDMMANIRKAGSRGTLRGQEWRAVHISIRIYTACIPYAGEEIAERLTNELHLTLVYLCQPWGAVSSDVIKDYLLLVFDVLHNIMVGPNMKNAAPDSADDLVNVVDELPSFSRPHNVLSSTSTLFGRYSAFMFNIMHYFSDLRELPNARGIVPAHVVPILDALLGVDSCNQVQLLFQLVTVSLNASDIISFNSSHSQSFDESDDQHENDIVLQDGETEVFVDIVTPNRIDENLKRDEAYTLPDSPPVNMLDELECEHGQNPTSGLVVSGLVDPFAAHDGKHNALLTPTERAGAGLSMDIDAINADTEYLTPQRSVSSPMEQQRVQNRRRVVVFRSAEREAVLQNWVNTSFGILLDRKDTELLRLSRTSQYFESGVLATKSFWCKMKRKYETEHISPLKYLKPQLFAPLSLGPPSSVSFVILPYPLTLPRMEFEWKLGVAHEGPFPARQRTVLKRRYFDDKSLYLANKKELEREKEKKQLDDENVAAMLAYNSQREKEKDSNATASIDPLRASGADDTTLTPCRRVSRNSSDDVSAFIRSPSDVDLMGNIVPVSAIAMDTAGQGWGLIDADGSGEDGGGFGVVNVIKSDEMDNEADINANGSQLNECSTSHLNADDDGALNAHDRTCAESLPVKEPPAIARSSSDENARMLSSTAVAASNALMAREETVGELALHGRSVETGPVQNVSSSGDGPLQQANVILVTASGSYSSVISFNKEEIWIVSTVHVPVTRTENDKLSAQNIMNSPKQVDIAAVNATSDSNAIKSGSETQHVRRRKWRISNINFIFYRRYRLRDSALEVLFQLGSPHKSLFVDFGHTKENMNVRDEFAKQLMLVAPSSAYKQPSNPAALSRLANCSELGCIQQRWIDGEIDNFEYLMTLNTLSGRTYNDLCQYPVMPWILSQYTENTIDLQQAKNYRDLTKPMGALNPQRLLEYLERYESLKENDMQDVPPFMYGSHYSTMVGVVLHYLVRMEPFASLHREIQSGHFDVPDRLFSSIPRCYDHNTSMLSEVKELTPEWFTTPEFLKNVNQYNFGKSQEGEVVHDVILPPWCDSAEAFIAINRRALESDYVSANIQHWIDLIFGYKQVGQAAVEACNVFYYLTYYGAVNRDLIDEPMRRAIELQIAHFGSHPTQLFRRAHPSKRLRINTTLPRAFTKCFKSTGDVSAGDAIALLRTETPLKIEKYNWFSKNAVENAHYRQPYSGIHSYGGSIVAVHCLPICGASSGLKSAENFFRCLGSGYGNVNVFDSVSRRCASGSVLGDEDFTMQIGDRFTQTTKLDEECVSPHFNIAKAMSDSGRTAENLLWNVRTLNSIEEFISIDAASTIVSRRRYVCRILFTMVLIDQIVCILDNGVIEVYRYGISDSAKVAVAEMEQDIAANRRKNRGNRRRIRKITSLDSEDGGFAHSGSAVYGSNDSSSMPGSLAPKSPVPASKLVTNLRKRRQLFLRLYKKKNLTKAENRLSEIESNSIASEQTNSVTDRSMNPSTHSNSSDILTDIVSFDDRFVSPNLISDSGATLMSMASLDVDSDGDESDEFEDYTGAQSQLEEEWRRVGVDLGSRLPDPDTAASLAGIGSGDIIIAVERDTSHFEVTPRLPLAYVLLNGGISSTSTSSDQQHEGDSLIDQVQRTLLANVMTTVRTIHCETHGNRQLLTIGFRDGRVLVRTFDARVGTISHGAEFRAHRHPVVDIASDSIQPGFMGSLARNTGNVDVGSQSASRYYNAGGNSISNASGGSSTSATVWMDEQCGGTSVVVTVDESGLVYIWTMGIRKVATKPSSMAASGLGSPPVITNKCILSKRPLYKFKCLSQEASCMGASKSSPCGAEPHMYCCDISANLNIVVTASSTKFCTAPVIISIYSLERNELVNTFTVANEDGVTDRKCGSTILRRYVSKLFLSSFGVIVVHLVTVYGTESKHSSVSSILSYSLLGCLLGSTTSALLTPEGNMSGDGNRCNSEGLNSTSVVTTFYLKSYVTFASLPKHSTMLLTGHEDGSVCIWDIYTVTLAYSFKPHEACQRYIVVNSSSHRQDGVNNNGTPTHSRLLTVPASPILHVNIGPNKDAPILITCTTLSGEIYVKPLPDFISVEKNKGVTTLAQLVSAPMTQISKTTTQVASWTQDTAGVFAQNAKQMADDAMGELKKLKRNSIVKGVGSLFGFGGSANSSKN